MKAEIENALKRLVELGDADDYEASHVEADEILVDLLLSFGCPKEVIEAYNNVGKWYA